MKHASAGEKPRKHARAVLHSGFIVRLKPTSRPCDVAIPFDLPQDALKQCGFRVVLNRVEGCFDHPHYSSVCDKQTIKQLREYWAHIGVSPSSYDEEKG